MPSASLYTTVIRELLDELPVRYRSIDPRHIEGFIRLKYSTLDHLSSDDFRADLRIAADCTIECVELAEDNARSFGL